MQVVVDGQGTIVIADTGSNCIRAIDKTVGTTPPSVTTLVGGQNVPGPMCKQRVDRGAVTARPGLRRLDADGAGG